MEVEKLLAAQPIVLALLALVLLVGIAYKTVPVLVHAATHSLKDSSSRYADKGKVDQLSRRLQELAPLAGQIPGLRADIDKLEEKVDEEVAEVHRRIGGHIDEETRTHAAEALRSAQIAERVSATEATQRELLKTGERLEKGQDKLMEDVTTILVRMGEKR